MKNCFFILLSVIVLSACGNTNSSQNSKDDQQPQPEVSSLSSAISNYDFSGSYNISSSLDGGYCFDLTLNLEKKSDFEYAGDMDVEGYQTFEKGDVVANQKDNELFVIFKKSVDGNEFIHEGDSVVIIRNIDNTLSAQWIFLKENFDASTVVEISKK